MNADTITNDLLTKYAQKFCPEAVVLSVKDPRRLACNVLVYRKDGQEAKAHQIPRTIPSARASIRNLIEG